MTFAITISIVAAVNYAISWLVLRRAAQLATSTARALCTALEADAQCPGIHERVRAVLREGAIDAMTNGWDDMTPGLADGLHASVRAAVRGTMGEA